MRLTKTQIINDILDTAVSKETIDTLGKIISTAEKFKASYFWHSPHNASGRRYMEAMNTYEKITWQEGGHEYSAAFNVTCSSTNVYASGSYTKDGVKTTLTSIRNSYKRLTGQ